MMRVADYIMERLAQFGVEDIFMITGGGAMHLNDAAGRRLRYFCNHHEQASAIAAEGYARISGKPAVVLVTTGPGGLNTLTGVMGQWTDSVPVIYISGQVKFETTIRSCSELALRQLGDQEVNIVDVVRPLTKYAECVTDPLDIRCALEQAWFTATTGRPGPVWLDIPMNVQGAVIDESLLVGYQPALELEFDINDISVSVDKVIELLDISERPIIVAGHGIRISKGIDAFESCLDLLPIPVVSSFNGFDLVPSDHPLFVGRIGTIGDRSGNFALQNADLILFLGTRNNIRQISYGWETVGRAAIKVVVDIDAAELQKPTLTADIKIHADVKFFLECLSAKLASKTPVNRSKWLAWCRERLERYPTVLPDENYPVCPVHPYLFARTLSEMLPEDAIVVTSNATANIVYFQGAIVKKGQRVIWNSGCASMGYDLPAAIGACVASGGKRVVCLAGDGSIMMNLQELATIAYHQLPILVFVFNNRGYVSIRQTQSNFFGGLYGCDGDNGVSLPDIVALATSFGIQSFRLEEHLSMREKIENLLAKPGPVLCELVLDPQHTIEPKLSSIRLSDGRMVSKPLEDMSPLLERDEFFSNMIIEPLLS